MQQKPIIFLNPPHALMHIIPGTIGTLIPLWPKTYGGGGDGNERDFQQIIRRRHAAFGTPPPALQGSLSEVSTIRQVKNFIRQTRQPSVTARDAKKRRHPSWWQAKHPHVATHDLVDGKKSLHRKRPHHTLRGNTSHANSFARKHSHRQRLHRKNVLADNASVVNACAETTSAKKNAIVETRSPKTPPSKRLCKKRLHRKRLRSLPKRRFAENVYADNASAETVPTDNASGRNAFTETASAKKQVR